MTTLRHVAELLAGLLVVGLIAAPSAAGEPEPTEPGYTMADDNYLDRLHLRVPETGDDFPHDDFVAARYDYAIAEGHAICEKLRSGTSASDEAHDIAGHTGMTYMQAADWVMAASDSYCPGLAR
jgi:hypothetical protein